MPAITVATPSAVVPEDRLALGAVDARGLTAVPLNGTCPSTCYCTAEE